MHFHWHTKYRAVWSVFNPAGRHLVPCACLNNKIRRIKHPETWPFDRHLRGRWRSRGTRFPSKPTYRKTMAKISRTAPLTKRPRHSVSSLRHPKGFNLIPPRSNGTRASNKTAELSRDPPNARNRPECLTAPGERRTNVCLRQVPDSLPSDNANA